MEPVKIEIEDVLAIKIAPFNRYQTLDVIRAVAEAGRVGEISLYTGNDDNILIDLLTKYRFQIESSHGDVRIVGGLLGQWAVWTRKAVELLDTVHAITNNDLPVPNSLLSLAAQLTEANGAVFDAANSFAGCIPGIHYVLFRQGLLPGIWCLNPEETLSNGQVEEIDRVRRAYPDLLDDEFVRENIRSWFD